LAGSPGESMQNKEPLKLLNFLGNHAIELKANLNFEICYTLPEFKSCTIEIVSKSIKLNDIKEYDNEWTASFSHKIYHSAHLGFINILKDEVVFSKFTIFSFKKIVNHKQPMQSKIVLSKINCDFDSDCNFVISST